MIGQVRSGNPFDHWPEDTVYWSVYWAFIFGYPLVLMDITRAVSTNVHCPDPQSGRAPINQFANMPKFVNADFHDIVRPNVDTLYSTAWLDLSDGPIVLQIPDMNPPNGRYYLLPTLSGWTNVVASPGYRTNVMGPANIALVGPGGSPSLPSNITSSINVPTNMVWIIGRIKCTGTEQDTQTVNALQSQLRLVPLSQWNNPNWTPPEWVPTDPTVDMSVPPPEQVEAMPLDKFFTRFDQLLVNNPLAPADLPAFQLWHLVLGLAPGANIDWSGMTVEQKAMLDQAKSKALKDMAARVNSGAAPVNGWTYLTTHMGDYGTDYLLRAGVALIGLGANLPEDTIYPATFTDDSAPPEPLDGRNRYVLTFASGQLPPVNQQAFWSVTAYDPQGYFIPNPLNRYALHNWDALTYNSDGSLDIYLQADPPSADKMSNWLPVDANQKFNLMIRLYWPDQTAIDRQWVPPVVKLAN